METFSVTFFVITERGIEVVETKIVVLVTIATGTDPVGVIVDVTVTVTGVFVTEKRLIFKAEKSIHDVLAKKFASRKVVASKSVI